MYVCMYMIQIMLMTAHMYPEIEVVQTHRDKGTSCSIKGKNYSMQYDKLLLVPVYANNSNEALHRWRPGSMLR